MSQPRIEPALREALLRNTLLFSVPAAAFVSLVTWWGLDFFRPIWGLWVLDAVAASLVIWFTWTMTLASTNFGVVLQDGGVIVFEWGLRSGEVMVRFAAWEEVREPIVGWTGGAMKTASGLWLMMDFPQLKALLTDPRCPIRGKISPETARRLGISVRA